jgi:hypothetical protein
MVTPLSDSVSADKAADAADKAGQAMTAQTL